MNKLAIAFFILIGAHGYACALDAACTTTTNLGMARCPENSVDWYESYTDQIDELDALARTAKSSFTVNGAAGILVAVGSATVGGSRPQTGGNFYQYSLSVSSPIVVFEPTGSPGGIGFYTPSAGTGLKWWQMNNRSGKFTLEIANDAFDTVAPAIVVTKANFAVGNIGFKTSTPGATIDVNGDAVIRGQTTVVSTLTVSGLGANTTAAQFKAATDILSVYGGSSGGSTNGIHLFTTSAVPLTLAANNGTPQLMVASGGNVIVAPFALHTTTITASGYMIPPAWTLAQLKAATPAAAELGGMVICTNCAIPYTVCVATGATLFGFKTVGTGAATGCN